LNNIHKIGRRLPISSRKRHPNASAQKLSDVS
jgi:hypothetical protein